MPKRSNDVTLPRPVDADRDAPIGVLLCSVALSERPTHMPIIPWKRYWAPREGAISLGDGGFLSDPEAKYGRVLNPDLGALESLDDVQCLVLLGEPGIGKSTVAEDHYKRMKEASSGAERTFMYRDLRAYGSEDRIVRGIFEREEFLAWKRGAGFLDLYLDSLDECRVVVANVAALLVEQLQGLPHDRMRLRIGCRTAEWPSLLENECRLRFGDGQVRVLELAPLRRVDVRMAAEANGVAPDAFLDQLQAAAAVPLAIKPITLGFLLKIFAARGTLPSTQVDLYEQGCAILCQELSESRIAAGHLGTLGTSERLDVAAWLAAAMTFSGKGVIRATPSSEPVGSDEVTPADLTTPAWNVDEAAIRDVLMVSGLFTSRGPGRLGWAHKTHAEFLAARFLTRRNVSLAQIGDMVFHHQDREAIVPQLREAAAWIASMRPDVFAYVGERDPQVLLASDVVKADAPGRRQLVQHLLEAFDNERALDDNWDERLYYRKLSHQDLSAQLRPYITSVAKNVVVRRVAIDIAEACTCRDLEEILLHVALDKGDDKHIRQQAAHAIANIGDQAARLRLEPLLTCDADDDPQDELRGIALSVLYPEALSVPDLFALIAPARDEQLYGAYSSFLYERAQRLALHELPDALRWAAGWERRRRHEGSLSALQNAALRKGWEHQGDPAVGPELVRLVERRIKTHDNPFGRPEDEDVSRPGREPRRTVARQLLATLQPNEATLLLHGEGPLLDRDDFDWLLDEFEAAPPGAAAGNIAKLVKSLTWREANADRLSRVIGLALAHDVLGGELAEMVQPTELDSARADQMRENHRLVTGEPDDEEPKGVADPIARVEALVDRCEKEDIEWWWQLTRDLSLKPNDTHYGDDFKYRLTMLPGWASASENVRERVLALARRYLLEGDPANDAWVGTTVFRNSALSGYRALQLVLELDSGWLNAVEPNALRRWVPIVAAYPSEPNDELTRLAWAKCPDELLAAVTERLDHQRAATIVDANDVLNACWDVRISATLLAKAEATESQSVQNALIKQGLAHGDERFATLAERTLRTPIPLDASNLQRDARLALWSIVIRHSLVRSWTTLWDLMKADTALARDAWLGLATHLHRDVADILKPLTADQLAELFIWLATEFPPQPSRRRSGWVGPAESIADFRDAVLEYLKQRGDWSSLPAIDRIANALPNVPQIRLHRVHARRNAAQGTWQPVCPTQLAALVQDAARRFVESEAQLLALVLESLKRLELGLHDELSGIRDLWDKSGKAWRPVEEADLANRVARHLRDELEARGVVVNREVKIRRGLPGLEGQQTDIYVDAMASVSATGTTARLSVVVEAKGCWNEEVLTAMQAQLADRYVRDNACDHGLYLVGWFLDDGWDRADGRRSDAQRLLPDGLDASRKLFDEQAEDLSRDGKTIRAFVLDARLNPTQVPPKP